jgi:PAS domain S-box-containing protein
MDLKPNYEYLVQRVKELEKEVAHHKQSEKESCENKLRYQSLLDHAPVGIWHASPDGSGGFINSKLTDITGLTLESAVGTGWISHLHPGDKERVLRDWTNFVEGKSLYHSTYRFINANKEVRWVIGQASPVRTTSGDLLGYIGTLVDITDRKRLINPIFTRGSIHVIKVVKLNKRRRPYVGTTIPSRAIRAKTILLEAAHREMAIQRHDANGLLYSA